MKIKHLGVEDLAREYVKNTKGYKAVILQGDANVTDVSVLEYESREELSRDFILRPMGYRPVHAIHENQLYLTTEDRFITCLGFFIVSDGEELNTAFR